MLREHLIESAQDFLIRRLRLARRRVQQARFLHFRHFPQQPQRLLPAQFARCRLLRRRRCGRLRFFLIR